jgi:hypothetical protein
MGAWRDIFEALQYWRKSIPDALRRNRRTLIKAIFVVSPPSFFIGLAVHSLVYWRLPSFQWGRPMDELMIWLFYGLATAGVVCLLVLGASLFAAPVYVDRKQRRELRRLQTRLQDAERSLDEIRQMRGCIGLQTIGIDAGEPSIVGAGDRAVRFVLHLVNLRELLLSYTVEKFTIQMLGAEHPRGTDKTWPARPNEQITVFGGWITGVDWQQLRRVHATVSYVISYDTVPPTRPRRSIVTIAMDYPPPGQASADPGMWQYVTHVEE